MTSEGPHTNGSKFQITLKPMPEFDGKHVVFGEVLEGFDVLEGISNLHKLWINEETGEVEDGSTRILDAEEFFDEEFPDHRPPHL